MLHMTVKQLLANMTSYEISLWGKYLSVLNVEREMARNRSKGR